MGSNSFGFFCNFRTLGSFSRVQIGGIRPVHVAFGWQRGRTTYFFWEVSCCDPCRPAAELSEVLRGSPHGETL